MRSVRAGEHICVWGGWRTPSSGEKEAPVSGTFPDLTLGTSAPGVHFCPL